MTELIKYVELLNRPLHHIYGRNGEIDIIKANFSRYESSDFLLLVGRAGSGKTALVQKLALRDKNRLYFKLKTDALLRDAYKMHVLPSAGLIEALQGLSKLGRLSGQEIVLYIDEFEQFFASFGPDVIRALLSELAELANADNFSGIHVIAAITPLAAETYLMPNTPLKERIPAVHLPELSKKNLLNILKSRFAEHDIRISYSLLHEIIYKADLLATAQPKAEIMLADAMIGYCVNKREKPNTRLLDRVVSELEDLASGRND